MPLLFSIPCVFVSTTMGAMTQMQATAYSAEEILGIDAVAAALILAIPLSYLLIFGKKDLSFLTSVLVPLMSPGYILLTAVCLWVRRADILPVLSAVRRAAFSLRAATGGVGGFALSKALYFGTMRGLFGVLGDTPPLCTATALVLLTNFDAGSYAPRN